MLLLLAATTFRSMAHVTDPLGIFMEPEHRNSLGVGGVMRTDQLRMLGSASDERSKTLSKSWRSFLVASLLFNGNDATISRVLISNAAKILDRSRMNLPSSQFVKFVLC